HHWANHSVAPCHAAQGTYQKSQRYHTSGASASNHRQQAGTDQSYRGVHYTVPSERGSSRDSTDSKLYCSVQR
ncbi:hypothetical protein BGZ65_001098, partial [Modicella reniformis]